MAEVEMGSVYEMNKYIRQYSEPMAEDKIKLAVGNIGGWCSCRPYTKYYMLLCKELSDYTIFRLNDYNYNQLAQELQEVLKSRGEILGIDYMHGFDSYECWVRKWGQEPYMYMFFDCQGFIVEIE